MIFGKTGKSEDTYYGDGLNLYAYCHNNPVRYVDPSGHEGLICSKKYGELKKKEAEGGTLSEKEKRQIYEYEQNQKKSNGAERIFFIELSAVETMRFLR